MRRKLLLDHCVPWKLPPLLGGHDVRTAGRQGWAYLRSGKLLAAAGEGGFDAFITVDRNIRFQYNLKKLPLSVIELAAVNNRLPALRVLLPELETLLQSMNPRTFYSVGVH